MVAARPYCCRKRNCTAKGLGSHRCDQQHQAIVHDGVGEPYDLTAAAAAVHVAWESHIERRVIEIMVRQQSPPQAQCTVTLIVRTIAGVRARIRVRVDAVAGSASGYGQVEVTSGKWVN